VEVGGVEPPSYDAESGRLQVCTAIRVVGGRAADRRAIAPVSRLMSLPPRGHGGR
jgi:hypothetical protein